MIKIVLLLSGFIIILQSPVFALNSDQAQEMLNKEAKLEIAHQKKLDDWTGNKAQLLSEIRDLEIRHSWLEYQLNKYDNYIKDQKAVIKGLKRKKLVVKKIRIKLEPALDTVVKHLEKFVLADLPFLETERQTRLQFLKDSLTDYHIDLSEKLRRVLEALQVEAEYGKMVEKTETVLMIHQQATKVVVLRIGRLAMFYRSVDGKQVGLWDKKLKNWNPLPLKYSSVIAQAAETASGKRSAEILCLPMNKPF